VCSRPWVPSPAQQKELENNMQLEPFDKIIFANSKRQELHTHTKMFTMVFSKGWDFNYC
jgi:hypothetical protein